MVSIEFFQPHGVLVDVENHGAILEIVGIANSNYSIYIKGAGVAILIGPLHDGPVVVPPVPNFTAEAFVVDGLVEIVYIEVGVFSFGCYDPLSIKIQYDVTIRGVFGPFNLAKEGTVLSGVAEPL